ncbi:MAG: hypothetical protein IPO32_11305 [Crocinitomicaceae bacterium]|nr:hypothetical protein [Crocinitomicaceae bacterium]
MRNLLLSLFVLIPTFNFAQDSYPLEAVLQKGHARTITCYAFSPDNRFVVTGSSDNSLILWNIESGRQVRVFNRHSATIRSVSFNADGTKILTSSADNTSKVFEVLTGNLLTQIKFQRDDLELAFFSPDGTKIILYDNRDGVSTFIRLKRVE